MHLTRIEAEPQHVISNGNGITSYPEPMIAEIISSPASFKSGPPEDPND